MGNLLHLVAIILILAWAIGIVGLHISGVLIHLLLVVAVIALILRVVQDKKPI